MFKSRHSLALALSLCLTACAPQAASPLANPTAPVPSATPVSTSLPGSPPGSLPQPDASSTPVLTPTPSPTVSASPGLPANLAGIRFGELDRFLGYEGESTRFAVIALDGEGRPLDTVLPLEWSSSRPQDFSVDATGKLTALVRSGYSEIVVRVPGTAYEIRTIVNVSTGSSSGGGGGSASAPVTPVNAAPVIASLQASSNTVLGAGSLVRVSALANDAESPLTDASYSWSCSPQPGCGSFNQPNGSTVYWTAPPTAGQYTLTLTVSDGGQSTSQSVTIQLQTGSGQLTIN